MRQQVVYISNINMFGKFLCVIIDELLAKVLLGNCKNQGQKKNNKLLNSSKQIKPILEVYDDQEFKCVEGKKNFY